MITESLLSHAMDRPEACLFALDKADAEESLLEFIKQSWAILEPARPFKNNWHIEMICEHLEAVFRGDITRLLNNIPPRHMKSLGANVFFPAWAWIHKPSLRFMCISYSQDLSIRDSLKCRRLIQSKWYQDRWGSKYNLVHDQNQAKKFENNFTGFRLTTSVDGMGTGEGADIILIDDAHNVKEVESDTKRNSVITWWTDTMPTRLDDPDGGAFVLSMQRTHHQDLSGYILENAADAPYEHLCIPARYEGFNRIQTSLGAIDPRTYEGEPLWKSRFGDKQLKALELSMTSYVVAGQLQQRPAPRSGGFFKVDKLEIVERSPLRPKKRARWWDLAATKKIGSNDPDSTSGAKGCVKDDIVYIEDVENFQENPGPTEDRIVQNAQMDGVDTDIWMEQEPGASGKMVINTFSKLLLGYAFRGKTSTGNKETYANPLSAAIEHGRVRLVKGPWNKRFIDQLRHFPLGHDDDVDSASKLFLVLTGGTKKSAGVAGR